MRFMLDQRHESEESSVRESSRLFLSAYLRFMWDVDEEDTTTLFQELLALTKSEFERAELNREKLFCLLTFFTWSTEEYHSEFDNSEVIACVDFSKV